MYKVEIGKIALTEANRKWYEHDGLEMTGETLTVLSTCNIKGFIGFEESTTYVVFKGDRTPYMGVRDCGDHYIIAGHDRYDRIDKSTLAITKDVEDC